MTNRTWELGTMGSLSRKSSNILWHLWYQSLDDALVLSQHVWFMCHLLGGEWQQFALPSENKSGMSTKWCSCSPLSIWYLCFKHIPIMYAPLTHLAPPACSCWHQNEGWVFVGPCTLRLTLCGTRRGSVTPLHGCKVQPWTYVWNPALRMCYSREVAYTTLGSC